MPAAAQLAPCPASPRSYTVTLQPACTSRQAMPRPMTPAPTTIVFGRCDGTILDALMTDSLHRACPARFSGSDLSRRPCGQPRSAGQHPSLAAISSRPPRRCKDFLHVGFCAGGAAAHRALPHDTVGGTRSVHEVNALVRPLGHSVATRASLARRPQGHPPLKPWGRRSAPPPFFSRVGYAGTSRAPRRKRTENQKRGRQCLGSVDLCLAESRSRMMMPTAPEAPLPTR